MKYFLMVTLTSIFFSKSFFNTFLSFLLISGIIRGIKRKTMGFQDKKLWLLLLSFAVGIISNFITGGIEGVSEFASNERYFFYIPLFYLMTLEIEDFEFGEFGLLIGGIISSIYSTLLYFFPNLNNIFTPNIKHNSKRVGSFQNLIRWGALLHIINSLSFGKIFISKNLKYRLIYLLLFLFFIFSTIINSSRSTMVATAFSILFTVLATMFYQKNIKSSFITLVVLFSIIFSVSQNPYNRDRIKSIFVVKEDTTQVKNSSNTIRTSNNSNMTRINYWIIATHIIKERPFLGYGSGKSEETFDNFIKKSSEEYKKRYYNKFIKHSQGTPFENNIINMSVDNGLLFSFFYYGAMIIIPFFYLIKLIESSNFLKGVYSYSIILGINIFTLFFPGSDNYIQFISIFYMFYIKRLYEINNPHLYSNLGETL